MKPEYFNTKDACGLPGLLGLKITEIEKNSAKAELTVEKKHLAVNGYLHAGAVITLADTAAGSGCMANLPEGASSFTTIELKSNFMSTVKEGLIYCTAKCIHSGKSTQIWESIVHCAKSKKIMAKFTCTQFILYPR
ncbi:MAG: PaaI family thioesterase [Cellvibrionaceae bacterium]